MRHIDIFNGDADGIISLIQLRLNEPKDSILVTGVKRDNQLMNDFEFKAADQVTVLDISMEKNQAGLKQALDLGAQVEYFDHHRAGDIPQHDNLFAQIDTSADMCTALLVDAKLKGKYRHWAIAAAYGDNLIAKANELAEAEGLNKEQRNQLKELGVLVNYNGYGSSIEDLHFAPAELFNQLRSYHSPFDVITDPNSPFRELKKAYEQDMSLAKSVSPHYQSSSLKVVILPNSSWARRVSGVLGNELANSDPSRAHLILTKRNSDTSVVSLRSPISKKYGAGDICAKYDTGGGRESSAGINNFPLASLNSLVSDIESFYCVKSLDQKTNI
ncbi:DHH family phosphoesterase [Agarivorans sp. DSG3-1]|uniref:DHH family phosphoesterase n=1 Tax=Agarivorans sp. DSG3-1 TaxID=3342249 RepID=UPI00398EB404